MKIAFLVKCNYIVITMKARIIRIGNSKGLRLSKTILERYEMSEEVDIVMKNDHIEIHPSKEARKGWSEKMQKLSTASDDELLIPDVFEDEMDVDGI